MDAGKIMWVLYEHPEVDFYGYGYEIYAISVREFTHSLKMGEKAYFIASPNIIRYRF